MAAAHRCEPYAHDITGKFRHERTIWVMGEAMADPPLTGRSAHFVLFGRRPAVTLPGVAEGSMGNLLGSWYVLLRQRPHLHANVHAGPA